MSYSLKSILDSCREAPVRRVVIPSLIAGSVIYSYYKYKQDIIKTTSLKKAYDARITTLVTDPQFYEENAKSLRKKPTPPVVEVPTVETIDPTPTPDELTFDEQKKKAMDCRVCEAPSTMQSLSAMLSGDSGTYRLPMKRKVKKSDLTAEQLATLQNAKTIESILKPKAPIEGLDSVIDDMSSYQLSIMSNLVGKPDTPHQPTSFLDRFTSEQLELLKRHPNIKSFPNTLDKDTIDNFDLSLYTSNDEEEEFEIDYSIPDDPELRALELGTDVDNNVPIILNDDGTVSPHHCPPGYFELSRGTWTYLHTMAAYYPEEPTDDMKVLFTQSITNFPHTYPCPPCRDHMIDFIEKNPIPTANNRELSVWMCELHNDVNKMQGKRLVQCNADYLLQRYKDGYGDGRCP